jgi:hypothetical protein
VKIVIQEDDIGRHSVDHVESLVDRLRMTDNLQIGFGGQDVRGEFTEDGVIVNQQKPYPHDHSRVRNTDEQQNKRRWSRLMGQVAAKGLKQRARRVKPQSSAGGL